MNRYTLHVPLVLNDGAPTPRAALRGIEDRLVDRFGGFTATTGTGGWKGADRAYVEPVQLYHVDTDRYGVWDELRELAQTIATQLGQEAVYITRQTIFAAMIAPAVAEEAA